MAAALWARGATRRLLAALQGQSLRLAAVPPPLAPWLYTSAEAYELANRKQMGTNFVQLQKADVKNSCRTIRCPPPPLAVLRTDGAAGPAPYGDSLFALHSKGSPQRFWRSY
ncbi:pterin-4-alpha-carbinolamine dehydratase 2 isoform X2 [Macaca thibetana thibetana]|uniref:pterin-4-alpha-carbinolamine dehydratase 2 isoform X2 n=1 Tax=Macaca thibetana thibetana TaxID=257877 RepID=UPI0021BCE2D0|nr:pterin-4-alpha-carbinolamine dehydratase 2 isoform X2 [Macaca thibetana thibetana]